LQWLRGRAGLLRDLIVPFAGSSVARIEDNPTRPEHCAVISQAPTLGGFS